MTKRCRFCAEEIQDAAVLCRFCGREQHVQEVPSSNNPWVAAAVIVAVLLFGGGIALSAMYSSAASTGAAKQFVASAPVPPPPPPPPTVVQVADEAYRQLPSTSYIAYSFELGDDRPCLLQGHIQVTEGGSHDVDVLVLDEDGMQNFQNGNSASTYLNEHRTSALTLDLRVLAHKKYYLVISNRFSLFTGKTVSLENVHAVCGDLDGDGVGDY